ncbi:response regulator [Bradyrhizobium sp. CB82]|uniref:response regulator transcription factor n=1 Tax=Bradyrhizobium sp. CB82 TaxID=3039159 RepID=UPI0024B05510|nr:response regulator [Bradyrhizobium sp. CB82]WFU45276.1 response regulator [Bradyrhizobium sp. CB82]
MLSTPMISVVDDDTSVRFAIENLLKSRDYIVHTFASAEKFLRSPQLSETSCVITDVQMAVMSGLDLLREMRAQRYDAPFIFMTAFGSDRIRASALNRGAVGFLPKPFAGHTLFKHLDAALEQHRDDADA